MEAKSEGAADASRIRQLLKGLNLATTPCLDTDNEADEESC